MAASITACRPYGDSAFDSPNRNAVTAERKQKNPISTTMYQSVAIFPSKQAESAAIKDDPNGNMERALTPATNRLESALGS